MLAMAPDYDNLQLMGKVLPHFWLLRLAKIVPS